MHLRTPMPRAASSPSHRSRRQTQRTPALTLTLKGNDLELDPNREPEPPTKVIDKPVQRTGKRNPTAAAEGPAKDAPRPAAGARGGRTDAGTCYSLGRWMGERMEESIPWTKEGETCYAKGNGCWHEERTCANTEFHSWRPEAPRRPSPQRYAYTTSLIVLGPPTDNIQSPVVMALVVPSVAAAVAVVAVVTAPVAVGPSAMTVTATLALGKLDQSYQFTMDHLTDIPKASTRSRPVTAGASRRVPLSGTTRRPVPTSQLPKLRTTTLPTLPLLLAPTV